MLETILIVILVLVAVSVIGLVLIQHGKGADVGAAFGSGASSTVFGSQGSTSFLMKLTLGLIAVFFAICITLTHMASSAAKKPFLEAAVPVTPRTEVSKSIETVVPPVPSDNKTLSEQPVKK